VKQIQLEEEATNKGSMSNGVQNDVETLVMFYIQASK
jgi:hypothetical protein